MILEWIAEKGTGLMAVIVAVGLIAVAFLDTGRWFLYIILAVLALIYARKEFKKRATPFERRERELRRKKL